MKVQELIEANEWENVGYKSQHDESEAILNAIRGLLHEFLIKAVRTADLTQQAKESFIVLIENETHILKQVIENGRSSARGRAKTGRSITFALQAHAAIDSVASAVSRATGHAPAIEEIWKPYSTKLHLLWCRLEQFSQADRTNLPVAYVNQLQQPG